MSKELLELLECMGNESWLLGVADKDINALKELDNIPYEVARAVSQLCDEMKKTQMI
jgi:hypothetical protein